MLVDSYILPECIVTPGSFGGLMALYEANFIKLRLLVTELEDCAGEQVSHSSRDCALYLRVDKRSKYTCELGLTYLFPQNEALVAEPDLLARVYFDARMAEVKGWLNTRRHAILRQLGQHSQRQLGLCWSRNMMFSKWLDYLLENGHAFTPVQALSD